MNEFKSILMIISFLIYFYFREMFIENSFPETNAFFRFIKKHNSSIGFFFGFFGVLLLSYLMFSSFFS